MVTYKTRAETRKIRLMIASGDYDGVWDAEVLAKELGISLNSLANIGEDCVHMEGRRVVTIKSLGSDEKKSWR